MGEEVVRDGTLGAVAKGGIVRRRRYAARLGFAWARGGRRVVGLCGLDACAGWWGTLFGSPKPCGENIGDAVFLLAAENVHYHC